MTTRTRTSEKADTKAAERIEERLRRLRPLLDDLQAWLSLVADHQTRDRLSDEIDFRLSQGMSDRHQTLVGAALRAPRVSIEALVAAVSNVH